MQLNGMRRRQQGMSLTEVILATGIAITLMMMMAQMQASAASDMRAKNLAESMQAFSQLAAQYLVLANADNGVTRALVSGGVDANTYCTVGGVVKSDTTLHVCAVDSAGMVAAVSGFGVPGNYSDTNSYNQKWVAIFKLADLTCTVDCAIEMLTIGSASTNSNSGSKAEELYLAASLMGANGGVVPCAAWGSASCANVTDGSSFSWANGSGGAWKARLDLFGAK